MEREITSSAVAHAFVSEELETFEQGPVCPTKSDQIFVRDAVTGTLHYIELMMSKFVLETFMALCKGIHIRLSATSSR